MLKLSSLLLPLSLKFCFCSSLIFFPSSDTSTFIPASVIEPPLILRSPRLCFSVRILWSRLAAQPSPQQNNLPGGDKQENLSGREKSQFEGNINTLHLCMCGALEHGRQQGVQRVLNTGLLLKTLVAGRSSLWIHQSAAEITEANFHSWVNYLYLQIIKQQSAFKWWKRLWRKMS